MWNRKKPSKVASPRAKNQKSGSVKSSSGFPEGSDKASEKGPSKSQTQNNPTKQTPGSEKGPGTAPSQSPQKSQKQNPSYIKENSGPERGSGTSPSKSSSKPQHPDPKSSKGDTGSTKKSGKAPVRNSPTPSEDASESSSPSDDDSDEDSDKVAHQEAPNDVRISFIARTQELTPIFDDRGKQSTTQQMWDPPRTAAELKATHTRFFRWREGRMENITTETRTSKLVLHNVSSVFVQNETQHLLISDVAADTSDVSRSARGNWTRLFFNHERVSRDTYYTALDIAAQEELTAARMSNDCVPQLIPKVYDNANSTRINAGVIGRLSLLIALAVLSAPKENTAGALATSIHPGEWHRHRYPPGRDERYRGVVVNICYDPQNPHGSNRESLTALERGELGPFYD